jgi:nucleotide-binding universal stress UspA family protein
VIAEENRVVRIGDATTEILDYLAENPTTLVIMGRRGLSPIKTLLMGSVSDKVMRHGGNAVMVVG